MNTFAYRTLAASAVLIVGLAGCSSPASETSVKSTDEASSAPTESVTPTPTPTPKAKAYSAEELAALVGQLKDSKGVKLSVMSMADLSGSLEQSKAMLSSMSVTPAECQEMALSGAAPSIDGATAAMGTSLDAASGMTAVVMTSGLDAAFLEKSKAQSAEISKCEKMTFTVGAVTADATLTLLDGVSSVPGTLAFQTDTTMSTGQHQSTITAQSVSHGVLITVIATGGASKEEAVSRTATMMDEAAGLLK
jgi:hypothetical protein